MRPFDFRNTSKAITQVRNGFLESEKIVPARREIWPEHPVAEQAHTRLAGMIAPRSPRHF